jgi:RNA polymerase sigma-70 factor (ECF subfamily)
MTELRAQATTTELDARTADAREFAFLAFVESRLLEHYRLAAVVLGNPAEAEDAVQDAIVRAWTAWPTLQDVERFDAWVGRIVVNECRDRLRRRRRRPAVTDISSLIGETLAAPDELRASADRDEIGRAFAALKPDQQIAVALRYYADLTVDQIAERVGAPAGTVKSRLHHALALMKRELVRMARGGLI